MAKAKNGTYKTINASLDRMTENDLVLAIESELGGQQRTDMIARLVGRFNRMRGQRVKLDVFAAVKRPGKKDINALLDRHG